MANNLTALTPTLFSAARIVPKELTGFLGAHTRDFNDQGVSKGAVVKVQVVPRLTSGSTPAPSMTWAAGDDRTPTTTDLTLNQDAQASWNLKAEEERLLFNGAGNAVEVFRQTIEGGIRELRNQIEAYLGVVAKNAASRSLGTSGTTPFASNFDVLADLKKLHHDNGVATDGRTLIVDTTAEANLSKLSALFKVNEAGTADLLRNGVLGRLQGYDIRASAGVASHTKGTGTSYVIDGTGNTAVRSTVLKLKTGSGTIVAGDAITIGSYTYGVTGALSGGLVTIQEPGLRAVVADGDAVTVANNYTANIALHRSAMAAAIRPALQPVSADVDQMVLTDAETQFSCLLIRKVGDGMSSWYLRVVYDAFAPNGYGIASLRG